MHGLDFVLQLWFLAKHLEWVKDLYVWTYNRGATLEALLIPLVLVLDLINPKPKVQAFYNLFSYLIITT